MSKESEGWVLLSWIAKRNDPYQELKDGRRVPGPTLGLLFEEASPYRGQITDVVLFARDCDEQPLDGEHTERQILDYLTREIQERDPGIIVHRRLWDGEDPTDYEAIHAFLKAEVPRLREQFPGREWVIHISPGTPAMQTIWVLMVETGQIPGPVTMVKSYRPWERKVGKLAVPVRLNLETLFRTLPASRPAEVADEGEEIFWNPARFRSDRLKALYAQARRIAHLNVPVLILGERGTGKTTLASWIRLNSPFRKKQLDDHWPSLACGAYTAETMRSELLGHKKGAFTGADRDKPGLFKQADGDTLFLDEIGDISPDLQRLLIRAIEEKRFYPLGADRPEQSNFRLITATNRPLADLRRRLDDDFFDRIGQFVLRLPSLREIPEEIPWLWSAVLQEALRRAGARTLFVPLDEEDERWLVEQLQRHPLPGNIRDLFKVANQLIASRIAVDEATPVLPPDEAIRHALKALEADLFPPPEVDLSRALAASYAKNLPLDSLLENLERVEIKDYIHRFSAYLADEVLRYAERHGRNVDEWTDYTRRRLQDLRKARS